jgi:hypothetical protein
MSTISDLEALIKSAERSIARGDFDAAEAGIDYANSVIRKAKRAADEEDDSDYNDASNPSMDAADDDDGDDGEDDEDDDDSEPVAKAWHEHSNAGSPHRMRGQHVRVQQPETYRLSAAPQPQGRTKRHRFDSRVEHIKQRDGVSKTEAMSRARVEHPVLYSEYQNWLADRSTSRQHMTRGHNLIGKGASTTYEDLVSEQIAKGCSPELAAQRVVQLHGYEAMRNRMFTKTAEDITKRFQREVEKIMYEDGCDATEATRLARIENPTLFKALQLV